MLVAGEARGAVGEQPHQISLADGGQCVKAVGNFFGAAEPGQVVQDGGLFDDRPSRLCPARRVPSRLRARCGSPSATAAHAWARVIVVSNSIAGCGSSASSVLDATAITSESRASAAANSKPASAHRTGPVYELARNTAALSR